jgi:hypothetical protein
MRLAENGMVVSGLAHHERPKRAVSPTATVRLVLAVKSEMESCGEIVRPGFLPTSWNCRTMSGPVTVIGGCRW